MQFVLYSENEGEEQILQFIKNEKDFSAKNQYFLDLKNLGVTLKIKYFYYNTCTFFQKRREWTGFFIACIIKKDKLMKT